jgi:hypothetical protein
MWLNVHYLNQGITYGLLDILLSVEGSLNLESPAVKDINHTVF